MLVVTSICAHHIHIKHTWTHNVTFACLYQTHTHMWGEGTIVWKWILTFEYRLQRMWHQGKRQHGRMVGGKYKKMAKHCPTIPEFTCNCRVAVQWRRSNMTQEERQPVYCFSGICVGISWPEQQRVPSGQYFIWRFDCWKCSPALPSAAHDLQENNIRLQCDPRHQVPLNLSDEKRLKSKLFPGRYWSACCIT